jgi:hypothetical protein
MSLMNESKDGVPAGCKFDISTAGKLLPPWPRTAGRVANLPAKPAVLPGESDVGAMQPHRKPVRNSHSQAPYPACV